MRQAEIQTAEPIEEYHRMIRRELARSEPPQRDASLVFLNAIHRHAKATRLQVTDLVHVLNQLLPEMIEAAAIQRAATDRQGETLDRIAATLERIEQAMAPTPEPPGSGRAQFQSRPPIVHPPIDRRCVTTVISSSERPPLAE